MENRKDKPAYLIGSSFMPEGHPSLKAYGDAVHELFEKAGAELIVAGYTDQEMHHFEGEWKEDARITIFKFPSMQALLSVWNSEEYQKAKHLRTDVVPPNFTFAVEGFDPSVFEKLKY